MRNLRWILPLILLLVLMASCSNDHPVVSGGEVGYVTEADVPIPDDTLPFQLSEGVAGYDPSGVQLPIAETTPLTAEELQAVLVRLPAVQTEAGDVQEYALPSESLPPPRPGVEVDIPFPPAETLPAIEVESGPVEVLRFSPEGDVPLVPRLSVTFNQPMVALTSHAELEQQDVPVKMTPDVPGHWRWVGTKTLFFEADVEGIDRFPMATEYTVEIPAGVESATGTKLAEAVAFSFRTPPPVLGQVYPSGGPQQLNPLIFASFDQAIDPDAVLESVEVKAGGKEYPIRLATDEEIAADSRMAAITSRAQTGRWLVLRAQDDFPKDTTVSVNFLAGTPSAEGPRVTEQAQSFSFQTYGALRVVRSECAWGGNQCPPFTPWSITFSNPLDASRFDPSLVSVEPQLSGTRVEVFGNNIQISGNSQGRTKYAVTLKTAITDVFGQKLGQDVTVNFQVGPAEAFLSVPGDTFVVMDPLGKPTLSAFSVNIPRVNVEIYAVEAADFLDFLAFFQDYNRAVDAPPPGRRVVKETLNIQGADDALTETAIDLSAALQGATGNLIVKIAPDAGPLAGLFNRDLAQRVRDYTSYRWVQVTQIGLDAFFDADEVVAWANSLADGAPLNGVEISLWPAGKSGVTDENGIVKLALPAPDQAGAALLLARKGDDVAFVPQNSYYYSEGDGWRATPESYEARYYVFDDRQMYRPEETVSIKGWIRALTPGVTGDVELLSQSAATSVNWLVTDPVGNEIGKGDAPLTALGGFDFQFKLPENVNLGYAQVQLTAMGGELQYFGYSGTHYHSFQIQEFRRPEFEVTASTSEGPFFVGGSAIASVAANYYSGGPLPGADASWTVRASSGFYQPPNWSDFSFGTWIPWWRFYGGEGSDLGGASFDSRTDSAGEHNLRLDFRPSDPPGPVLLDASVTVFDVNRQGWSSSTSLLVHPADRYVGLRSDRYFVEKGDPLPVEVVVTDLDGAVDVEHEVTVRAALLDWEYKNGDWQQVEIDAQECTVRTTAAVDPDDAKAEFATCTFETTQGGQLQITASITDGEGRSNQSQITRWIGGGRGPVARNVEQEEVQLIPSGEKFQPGDVAELLIQSPFFPAEGLVTLRRGGLVSTERFSMDGPTYVVRVPIEDSYIPEITVQVDLVGAAQRTDDKGNPLTGVPSRPAYAVGSLTLAVPPISRRLSVEAVAQASRLEPGGSTTLDLTVTDADGKPVADAELAVVVVDESILALTGYQLIDPISVFYAGRGSNVFDIHNRANLLLVNPEMLQQAGAPGMALGGGADMMRSAPAAAAAPAMAEMAMDSAAGAEEAKQAGTPIRVRSNFDPLALFAPNVQTDADGKASVEVTVPDNLTRYRVMVVAVGGGKYFGSGEASVTARLPLMVRPSAPRFLNFGDSFELPVVLQNQTDDDLTVHVAVKATNADLLPPLSPPHSGGETVAGGEGVEAAGYSLTVPANNRVEVRFPTTTASAGTARFQFAGVSGDYADAAEVSLPVWTPATTEAFAVYGQVDEGAILQPLLPPDDVIPTYGGLEVSMSSTAVQALTDSFLYLVKYPYECSEQMASRILAVAALRDVLTAFDAVGLPTPEEINAAVARDIQNLQAMQDYNGGFPIWRRGGEVWPYYSVHVAHALARAKLKDYPVPADMFSRSQDYLRNIESYIPSWYGERGRSSLIAYSLYVRKLMGDVDTAKANKLIAERKLENLSMESIGWLLSVLSGDNASAQTLDAMRRYLNNQVTETAGAANFADGYADGDYLLLYSNRRADAVILEAMITDSPDSDLIPKLVKGLLSQRDRGRWGNTQENIFVLLAMDKYFNTYEAQTPDFVARIWLGEQYAGGHEFVGRTTENVNLDVPMAIVQASRSQADGDGQVPLVVQKDGLGRLYYRLGLRYAPTSLLLEAADYGFTVERTYEAVDDAGDVTRDAEGVWHVKAGARVRVRLTMVAQSRRYHVALIDPIPAGFEALNPALAVTGDIPKDPASQANPYGGWWWWGPWYEHQNLRDERVEAFTSLLWEGVYTYTYVARATTPGTFIVPPTKAEEMYSPEVFGRSGTERVVIED